MAIDKARFAELLAKAKAAAAAAREQPAVEAATAIQQQLSTVTEVDTTLLGITNETIATDEGADIAVDILREVISNTPEPSAAQQENTVLSGTLGNEEETQATPKEYGVNKEITLNTKQQEAHDAILAGKDVVVCGSAGTGKTTSMKKTTRSMIDSGHAKPLHESTKWLQAGLPGIIVVSYTRKAVNNIRHAVVEELKSHTLTLHKVLEFAPVYYEIEDAAAPSGFRKTMRFEPQRNFNNPLPSDLVCVLFEESSMIAGIYPHAAHQGELYNLFQEAMPHKHQEVFIGDIQQLPPIFGSAILGFKMLQLPIIEYTEVYRQALESPIINLAWAILGGNSNDFSGKTERYTITNSDGKEVSRVRVPALDKFSVSTESGTVKFQPWQKRLSSDHALLTVTKQFTAWADSGYYNSEEDIILCPFNKACGTIEINKGIAQHLGVKRKARVFEVIAGFNKHYLAVGDRVLYDKEDAVITDIVANTEYLGKRPIPASESLDRWGHYREKLSDEAIAAAEAVDEDMDEAALEKFMASAATEEEDRVTVASHVVCIRYLYGDGEEVELESAGEINNMLGGYALTVHKAQGSEWQRVFFLMHHSYAVMNSRELLYTAVTRASKFLHIICETDTFQKGINQQRIKGNTLLEKAEFFKGKQKPVDEAKQQEFDLRKAGDFQAGAYKGKQTAVAIAVSASAKPVELLALHSLIPEGFKQDALACLNKYWTRACVIWGDDNLGHIPSIDYRLQRHDVLGTANAGRGIIKLNPVWCLMALDNQIVRQEMLHTTLIHEICHIIGARYGLSKGHDSGWIMSMKLMGVKPEVTYSGDTLPPWMEAYRQLAADTRAKLSEENYDVSSSLTTEEGEEV